MQYFNDRKQAGQQLAAQLGRYKDSWSVVIALSLGGVEVGVELAKELHLPLGLLHIKEISLPWKDAPVVGALDSTGQYHDNPELSESSLNEYKGEYHGHIDKEIITAAHEINLMHVSNILSYERLKDRNIILTSDGVNNIRVINEAMVFLKPARTPRTIAALPVATIEVVDKLHISVDEIHCLDVKSNYLETDHYYQDNTMMQYPELLSVLANFDTVK